MNTKNRENTNVCFDRHPKKDAVKSFFDPNIVAVVVAVIAPGRVGKYLLFFPHTFNSDFCVAYPLAK